VVATIEGKAWTKAEFDAMVRNLRPIRKGTSGPTRKAAATIRADEPAGHAGQGNRPRSAGAYKQRLEYSILQFLAQSYVDARAATPTLDDETTGKWFEAHKNEYKRARVLGSR